MAPGKFDYCSPLNLRAARITGFISNIYMPAAGEGKRDDDVPHNAAISGTFTDRIALPFE